MNDWATIIAMLANGAAITGGVIAFATWQRQSRDRVDQRHKENQDALRCIKDELADIRPKVKAMWAHFVNE